MKFPSIIYDCLNKWTNYLTNFIIILVIILFSFFDLLLFHPYLLLFNEFYIFFILSPIIHFLLLNQLFFVN